MEAIFESWRKNVLKEHKGKPCRDRSNKERYECEKREKELEKVRADKRKKDKETFPALDELTSLSRGVVETAKRKPQCTSGNKQHDADGKFSKTANSRSWSDRKGMGKEGCVSGQYRMKGTPKKTWTKIRCGRADSGIGKAKHKCKDGSAAYQESVDQEEWVKLRKRDLDMLLELVEDEETRSGLLIEPVLEEVESNLNPEQVKSFCNNNGFNNLRQWLNRVNASELAQKGELKKKD